MNDRTVIIGAFFIFVALLLTCCGSESPSAHDGFREQVLESDSLSSALNGESSCSESHERLSSGRSSSSEVSSSTDDVAEGFVRIGNQVWMENNLYEEYLGWYEEDKYANPRCYEDDDVNCKEYGQLFEWFRILDFCTKDETYENNPLIVEACGEPNYGICPSGTHIPNKAEFEKLKDYLEIHPSEQVKMINQLAGCRNENGEYEGFGKELVLWSSTHEPEGEFDISKESEKAWALYYNDTSGFAIVAVSMYRYASVRCIKNDSE